MHHWLASQEARAIPHGIVDRRNALPLQWADPLGQMGNSQVNRPGVPVTYPSGFDCWSSAALIACTVHSEGQIVCSCLCQEEGTRIRQMTSACMQRAQCAPRLCMFKPFADVHLLCRPDSDEDEPGGLPGQDLPKSPHQRDHSSCRTGRQGNWQDMTGKRCMVTGATRRGMLISTTAVSPVTAP